MATARQTDVSLVIKARDEASRAIAAIDAALSGLFGTAKDGGAVAGDINQAVAALAKLDKAFAQSSGSTATGAAATQRQLSAIVATEAQLESYRKQLVAANAAQERFNNSGGSQTPDTQQRYDLVGAEIKSLERNIKSLERTLEQQNTQFNRSASSLAEMARQEKLAGAVTTFATKEAQDYTRALEEQALAAEKAAAAAATQRNIDRWGDSRTGKSAAASAGVFESMGPTSFEATEAAALAAAAARLRHEMNPLAAIQDRLNRELAELPRVAKAAKFSVEELAAAEKLLRDEADRAARAIGQQQVGGGKPSLFGLKPYELQNLGYQVNDVVTQLASGTSLVQTLAQQGGQILQLFPNVGSQIVSVFKNPYVIGFVATLGAIVLGLKEAGDQAERIRGFETSLGLNVDGGDYSAVALNAASEALDRYGMSAKDATDIVKAFVKEGVNPDAIEAFGRTAQNLSEIMGTDLKDAAEEVAKAFTGGYAEIEKLDEAYGFLTATQLESIRTMFEEGKASEARTEAYQLFNAKAEEVANNSRGPWSGAFRELAAAWEEFTVLLSDLAPIRTAAAALEGLGQTIKSILRGIQNVVTGGDVARQSLKVLELEKQLSQNPDDSFTRVRVADARAHLESLQKRLKLQDDELQTGREISDTIAEQAEARKKSTAALERETLVAKEKKNVEEAVEVARRKATEHAEKNFTLADQATKQAYIDQEVQEARAAALKKAADERKRAADEAARERKEQERLAKQTKFTNPVGGGVSSGFGPRKSPGGVGSKFHKGIDFPVAEGTTVRAPADGVVVEVGTDAKLGKYVLIDHGNKVQSRFGHLSDNSIVGRGDTVSRGDSIAKSGNTGSATTGAHLHWQVTVNNKPIDPMKGMFQLDGPGRFEINPTDALDDFETEQAKLDADRAERHDKFNRELAEENSERAMSIAYSREQLGLQGDALLRAQRQQAMAEAEAEARSKIEHINATLKPGQERLELTKEQVEKVRELEGLYFDATHASERFEASRSSIDSPVADLTALRDQLQQQIAFYQERGQTGAANQLDPQLDAVNAKLREAIRNAQAFYTALAGDPTAMAALGLTAEQIDTIKLGLEASAAAGQNLGYVMGIAGQQIAQQFAQGATSAIDRFAQSVAEGKNVFGSLLDAFRQFAAEFLRQIAQMIIQQMIFNAVTMIAKALGAPSVGGGSSGGGGLPGIGGGGFIPSVKNHSGGIVGQHGTPISGRPAWFANAVRYHTGGVAGLRPNEIATVLERGEEVLTRNDPRHRDNGGMGGGSTQNIKIINAIDAGDMMQKGLALSTGEKAIMNFIRSNSTAIKSALS